MHRNIIFVTHNPITRLQLQELARSTTIKELVHIETRANSTSLVIEGIELVKRCYFPCSTYYSGNELEQLTNAIVRVVDSKQEYSLIIPHLYNHMYAVLAELKSVKEVIYVEEGSLSLGLIDKINMKQYTYKEVVMNKNQNKNLQIINQLTGEIFEDGANQRVMLMPYLELQPFPIHPKYKGTLSITKDAFKDFEGKMMLEKPYFNEKIRGFFSEYTILYLPNLYCKKPNWINFSSIEILRRIIRQTSEIIKKFGVKQVVIKPHPSTPEFYIDMIRKSIEKTIDWETFVKYAESKNSRINIVEAAALPFRYAIFQCYSSALSYTRELSPSTEILYPYSFR